MPGSSQSQDLPTLATDADPSEITLGGHVVLTVRVEHSAGDRVVFPDSLDLGPFEVRAVETGGPENLGDRQWSWGRYTLTSFELGELEVPSFEVAVIDADGTARILDTSPWGVVVTSVGLDDGGDIRDVKSPLSIPLSLLILLIWILLALIALAVLYYLYRRHRLQPAADPVDIAAPLRRPYEDAYDRLRELEASGMLERGEIKEYYITVSEIIRTYIEAQYRVAALEMASFEVLKELDSIGVDMETQRDFEGFFAEADLVKFAKFRPDGNRARRIVSRARKLVDRTKVGRPAPVAVTVGAGVIEVGGVAEILDATDVVQGAGVADAAEAVDATEVADMADIADAAEVVDVTEVADVADTNDMAPRPARDPANSEPPS